MTVLNRPQIIEPFLVEDTSLSSVSFSTNLNEVEIVAKLLPGTKQVRLVLPTYANVIPENITTTVDYYKLVDDVLVKAKFGPDQGQVKFPLVEEFYIKFKLELSPDAVNVAVLRVHSGNYDYLKAPSDYPNNQILTEEITLNINQNSSAFLGVDPQPPSILYTDYKESYVDVIWEDSNEIDTTPISSGYKVYYTMEEGDRTSTYQALNTSLVSSYSESLSEKELIDTTVSTSTSREFVDTEGVGTLSDFYLIQEPSTEIGYYISEKVDNLVDTSFSVNIINEECFFGDTSAFEKLGALARVGSEEKRVVSYVPGVKVVFDSTWSLSGNQTLELLGDRLKELSEERVYSDASLEVASYNDFLRSFKYVPTFAISATAGSNTVNFNALNLDTSLFEVEGMTVEFKYGSNKQTLEVVSWVSGISVTFSDTFLYNFNQVDVLPVISFREQCNSYLKYINERLLNPVSYSLTPTAIDNLVFDANIISRKYKGLSSIYTYGVIDKDVSRAIEATSIILDKYSDLSSIYTYGVLETVDSNGFYQLSQTVSSSGGVLTPSYFYLKKTYISETEALLNEGLYSKQYEYSEVPLYEERYFREVSVETESISRKDNLMRKLQLSVDDTMLYGIDSLLDGRLIYFRVSFVYKDLAKKIIVESPMSKETFAVALSSAITEVRPDYPTESEIQKSLVEEILKVEPDINLSPGSITRSVFINPFSTAMENLNYREYFREVSSSFVSLLEFDGVDDLGNSLDVNDSIGKQQLREAYGLENTEINNALIQEYVDSRFDLLASNFGVTRSLGTRARGQVLYTIKSLPDGDNPVIVSKGSIVSTASPKLDFLTLNELRRDDFSIISTGSGYTATAYVQALENGSSYLVPANTITTVGSSNVSAISVTNPSSTYGGSDFMTNKELVDLVRRKLLSVDTGTVNGYLYQIASMGSVERAKIVTSGDPYMRRDYDFSIGRTGSGKVDVYVKGLYPMGVTQRAGFYYDDKLSYSVNFDNNIVSDLLGNGENYYYINLYDSNLLDFENFIDIYEITSMYAPVVEAEGVISPYFNLEGILIKDRFNLYIPVSTNPLLSGLEVGDQVIITLRCRKDFQIGWDSRPFVSVNSVKDSLGTVFEEGLNYLTYNNSYSLLERNSIIEDSGINIYTSPMSLEITDIIQETDAESGILFELDDCWSTSAPFLEDADNPQYRFFYSEEVDAPFTVVNKNGKLYINIRSPFESETSQPGFNYIREAATYRVYYGRDYSLVKTIQITHNTDIYIDDSKYYYFPRVSFEDPFIYLSQVPLGDSNTDTTFSLVQGQGNKVYFKLNSMNFNTVTSELKVRYYNNIPLSDAINYNDPIAGVSDTEFGITILDDIPYKLAHAGVDISTIILRPSSDINVKKEPYTIIDDYKVVVRDDGVYIHRNPSGSMEDGQSVSIEYNYSNEVDISYNYDLQVNQITQDLQEFAHAGSDFLVKSLNSLSIDIKCVVYLYDSNNKTKVDSDIRRDIFILINQLGVGDNLYQSDIIGVIEKVSGVRNIKVKLSTMSVSEGEVCFGDLISRDRFSLFSSGLVEVYYSLPNYTDSNGNIVKVLKNTPLNEGGFPEKERSVYVDGYYYELVSSPYEVSKSRGLAHISSNGSVYISFINPSSTSDVEVSYQVSSDLSSGEIQVYPFQYIELNKLELIYVEQ